MLLYSLLHLCGYDLSLEDIKSFRQLGSKTPGHPEVGHTPGVETTTGPLGQGFANAVGMALAEKMLAARFNTKANPIIDHYTYVLASDGDIMEGLCYEAASLAGHLGLGKLIAFYDSNRITIDGKTDLTFSEDVAKRFEACNWQRLSLVCRYSQSPWVTPRQRGDKACKKKTGCSKCTGFLYCARSANLFSGKIERLVERKI